MSGWAESGKDFEALPDKQWLTFRYDFDSNNEFYTVTVTYPDGKSVTGTTQHPFLRNGPVKEIRFVNILPQKSYTYVDDVVISYSNRISLANRTDFAPKATSTNAALAALVKNGKPMRAVANRMMLEFSPAVKINAVVLTPVKGYKLPDKITLRGRDNSGRWTELAKGAVIDPNTGYVQFKTLENVDRLELQFSGIASAAVGGLSVLAPAGTPQGKLDKLFAEKIEAEYKLPVYDRQYPGCDVGELTVINKAVRPCCRSYPLHQ